jgi:hypothetical protein
VPQGEMRISLLYFLGFNMDNQDAGSSKKIANASDAEWLCREHYY